MPWNTKLLAAGLLVLCSALALFVSDVIGENADKELNKLQGTWVMVSGEWDGEKTFSENVRQSKLIYEGNTGQLTNPHQSKETIVFDILKIDSTKNPKEMHFIRRNGPNAGKTIIGIYEFDGNDRSKFAFDPTGVTTLKEFTTKEGTGYIRQTWKRVKP